MKDKLDLENDAYDAKKISVLSNIDAIRKRPAMYGGEFLYFRMLKEVIDNSVDEYNAKSFTCTRSTDIKIQINDDKTCTVRDYGRGIPVDLHSSGVSALELVLTTLHAGGKFDGDAYKYSIGLHGVGSVLTNALSVFLEAKVYKNGKIYFIRFEKGLKTQEVEIIGECGDETGTEITFQPDTSIVADEISFENIEAYLKEVSILNKGLKIDLLWNGESYVYQSEKGLVSFIKDIPVITPFLHFENAVVCAIFSWSANNISKCLCFTNNTHQEDGGTHLSGFRSAMTRTLSNYIDTLATKYKDIGILPEDIHKSIVVVISCKLQDPQFSSQVKSKLVSQEARTKVDSFVSSELKRFLEENPAIAKVIVEKISQQAKERLAIEKTQEIMRDKNKISASLGKLIDCDSSNGILFITEGDSAGGSCAGSRDRKMHAILGLKGKVLNVEKADDRKVFKNEEISVLISVLGTGIGNNCDVEKLRYSKVVILADADVDGSHIQTLLLTFFATYTPQLINQGKIYLAKPPLYRIQESKSTKYIETDSDLDHFLFKRLSNKYKLIDGEGIELAMDDAINLFHEYEGLTSKIKSKCIPEEQLASVCSIIKTFGRPNQYLKKVFPDKKVELNIDKNGVGVSVTTMYGVSNFYVDFYSTTKREWPIKVNNKTFYDPISLYEYLKNLLHADIVLQRFKGLGEMNPEELAETVLFRPDSWYQIYGDEEMWPNIASNIQCIMGSDNRRDLVRYYFKSCGAEMGNMNINDVITQSDNVGLGF
jgi:DNA gyrase subunit B